MQALQTVGAAHLAERAPWQLSGGQKRAVAIAGVLAMHPDVLILDEPSDALDPGARRRLIHLLQTFEHTKIIATHDLDLVLDVCTRVIVLHEGRILADAHPHIGTDKLPKVIENMRNTILTNGGEVHFETRMDALIIKNNRVEGIETNTGQTFLGPVILATGHSARDVYRWLAENNVPIETKGLAVGVRLEHPSELIDQIQYHRREGRGSYLPAAEYSFVTQVKERGVYSFCMCPGGFVVPAASGPEQVVVNGMSPSNRGSKWSNSGMVVEIRPEDTEVDQWLVANGKADKVESVLKLMHFQEELERQSWLQGGMKQTAPAQRMVDFTNRKLGVDLPKSSYSPGLLASPLHFWLPDFISKRLAQGFLQFGKSCHGFLTNEAVMMGVETRTSSPIRIVRDKETMQHITIAGLFPCGEGAGYAGGIVSAGMDGERCAEAVAAFLNNPA